MKQKFPEIDRYIADKKKLVNKLLEKYIRSVREKHPGLADAVAHTLLSGKKIRPALCAAACEAVGGNVKSAQQELTGMFKCVKLESYRGVEQSGSSSGS